MTQEELLHLKTNAEKRIENYKQFQKDNKLSNDHFQKLIDAEAADCVRINKLLK